MAGAAEPFTLYRPRWGGCIGLSGAVAVPALTETGATQGPRAAPHPVLRRSAFCEKNSFCDFSTRFLQGFYKLQIKQGAFCAPFGIFASLTSTLPMWTGLVLPQVIRMDFIGTNHLDLNQNPVATMPSAIDRESNPPSGIISACAGTIVLRPGLLIPRSASASSASAS